MATAITPDTASIAAAQLIPIAANKVPACLSALSTLHALRVTALVPQQQQHRPHSRDELIADSGPLTAESSPVVSLSFML
jgi:hypothetical protein